MKYWILALLPTLLLITAAESPAHNLVTVQGKPSDHKHVYRRQEYGKPLQQGHPSQSAGGNRTVIWGSNARPEYGKSTVPRNGPIIGDQKSRRAAKPSGSKQYGSVVKGYGKAARGYGKSIWDHGKQ